MDDNRLAVVLATYNGGEYIKTQLDSILCQTFMPNEIIISDDGSSDNTKELLEEYAQNHEGLIKILKKDVPCGNARDNFLFLARQCDADYILFCDQDDFWHSDKIEQTMRKMNEMEAVYGKELPILVHTDLRVVDNALQELSPSFGAMQKLLQTEDRFASLLVQNVVTGCTMMLNRPLLALSLQADESKEILMHDWWFALVAAAFGKIGFLEAATIDYRQHGDNSVGAKDVGKLSYIISKLKDGGGMRKSLENTAKQAAYFAKVYEDKPDEAVKIAQEYGASYTKKKSERRKIIKKYQIYKQGFSRKIAQRIWG